MYSAQRTVKIQNFQTSSSLAELGPAQPQLALVINFSDKLENSKIFT